MISKHVEFYLILFIAKTRELVARQPPSLLVVSHLILFLSLLPLSDSPTHTHTHTHTHSYLFFACCFPWLRCLGMHGCWVEKLSLPLPLTLPRHLRKPLLVKRRHTLPKARCWCLTRLARPLVMRMRVLADTNAVAARRGPADCTRASSCPPPWGLEPPSLRTSSPACEACRPTALRWRGRPLVGCTALEGVLGGGVHAWGPGEGGGRK